MNPKIIRERSLITGIFTVIFLFLVSGSGAAQGATLTVSNTNDSGAGSLRQAIIDAASGDTIVFDSIVFASPQIINLTSGELVIGKNLTISGTGARRLTVRRDPGSIVNFRVFNVGSGIVSISGMTISNGNNDGGGGALINQGGTVTLDGITASGNSGGSGAIRNSSGTTTILNSTISNNPTAAGAGGILVGGGTVNIANSTVSGNSSSGVGGIGVSGGGTLNMNNVTVTGNGISSSSATSSGGVSAAAGGTVNLRNTIISGNTAAAGSSSPDVRGVFNSNGNNLIGNTTGGSGFSTGLNDKLNVSADLADLADNGGQTDTHRPNPGSPAIDAGNACIVSANCPSNNPPFALTTDQRGTGFPRQQNAGVDIGAVEYMLVTAAGVTISGRVFSPSGRGLGRALVTLTDSNGISRTVLTSPFGYYRFNDVAAGQAVVVGVISKKYGFTPQVFVVTGDEENLNFTAQHF